MDNMDRHGGQGRPRNQMLDPPNMKLKVEPTFDYSQNTNVTALIGKTAYLTCRVRNLGDKSVRFIYFLFLFPSWNTGYCSGEIVQDRLMFQKNGYLYIYYTFLSIPTWGFDKFVAGR